MDFDSNLYPDTNDSSSVSSAHSSEDENLLDVLNSDDIRAKWMVRNNTVMPGSQRLLSH